MNQYRVDGSLIIAVDHGFGNMKTANIVFCNGMAVYDTEPIMSRDYLFFEGKYYVLNQGHKPYSSEKINDDDFYILTIAAIAKELRLRGITRERVHLAVGLPLKWRDVQQEEFKKYLLRNKHVEFTYCGSKYFVDITGCSVMPQCYAAVAEKLGSYQGLNMLADIGNGTMNVMYLQDGRTIEKKMWTEILGVKQCALLIHDAVLNKFQVELDENLLNSYLMRGRADVDEEYLKFMEETAKTYVQSIFLKLKELGYNSKLMKLHFMGGGAKLVELFGEYEPARVSFNHDICANAKGFEYFCYLAMRKQRRA